MSFLINRRRFIQATSSAIAIGALSSAIGRAQAKTAGELRITMSGGSWAEAIMKAYVKPFEDETGVKVTPIMQDIPGAQISLMVKTNNVAVDVHNVSAPGTLSLANGGYLEKIDYSNFDQQELGAVLDFCKNPFGFGSYVSSQTMVYNTNKFPSGKPRPTSWAEYWDVKSFPGARSLRSGTYGTVGPWEQALLADGVATDALYPMDIDRIFASLDKIKPHVRKWWTNGAEILQIMRDDVAEVVQAPDARAISLIDSGAPFEINRNQAMLGWDYWTIVKGSPNVEAAQKFIASTARPERQAAFAKLVAQSPSNSNAYKLIPENVARNLATHPDYKATSFPFNAQWYAETGSDGMTNIQRLINRWNEWVLR
ncbi:ABC transporter substrate-binding protein [Rhizobium sp. CCGE532]|uniref:ABC transporter substrate-binding protein n=1 Tax=Rhizobium sp. CCGE532 TaxID=2364272 RepID=UPI000EAA2C3C|nr:ABC transporter substrate-binding protein [Rhizobium sp. CCGE532]AYG76854.1 ABC transporter substrate-binding protein [Rhizobium sp. CCGE532]